MGHTELVCATCLDCLHVQDAYEGRLIHMATLGSQRQYDEVLACLDTILEANRDRDHDRWLARSIAAHRVMIFLDAHRYAEAEQACEALAQLGFGDVGQRYEHARGASRTFEEQGRFDQAVVVIEGALRYQEIKELPAALDLTVADAPRGWKPPGAVGRARPRPRPALSRSSPLRCPG